MRNLINSHSLTQQSSAIEAFSGSVANSVSLNQDITQAMGEISTLAADSLEQARQVRNASLKVQLLADQLNFLTEIEQGHYAVFERYKEFARKGRTYPGKPGKGKRLAFGNNAEAYFCYQVQEGLVKHAKLAGFRKEGMLLLNNNFDASTGLENARQVLAWKPDIFVEFQADSDVNAQIGHMFRQAGIPVLAIDIEIPQASIIGTDNYGVAIAAGRAMAEQIVTKFGGIEHTDLIVLLHIPESGDAVMLRSEGVIDALRQDFSASKINPKILRVDGGIGNEEDAEQAMRNMLQAHPSATRIAFTGITDQMVKGGLDALRDAGRWQAENIVAIPLGLDSLGQQLLRDGLADVGVAFFPERYGETILPAVLTMLDGQPVPERMYVENAVITKDELNPFSPGR
jgi:ribose transport system substrate-binding protein